MTNENFLVTSYFAIGAGAVFLGWAIYGVLRRPFQQVVDAAVPGVLARLLKRTLFTGLVAPVLAGFLSVAYLGSSCSPRSYQAFVADRDAINEENAEAASSALWYAALSVPAWGLMIAIALAVSGHSRRTSRDSIHSVNPDGGVARRPPLDAS